MRRSWLSDTLRSSAASLVIAAALISSAHAQAGREDRGGEDSLDISDPRAAARELGLSGDDMRPDEQFETTLFGRTLIIGGELEAAGRYRANLEPPTDDSVVRLDPAAQLEFLYLFSDKLIAFAQINAFLETEVQKDPGQRDSNGALELDEAWLLAPHLFGSNFSLQVGRQQYEDRREWWWDDELDSVRLHYTDGRFTAFLGAAEHVLRTTTDDEEDDPPEEDDLFRLLGNAAYSWSKHDRVEAFLLAQRDHSSTPTIGTILREDDADEADSDLTWLGVRARTRQKLGDAGKLFLNVDFAVVDGEEDVFDFADASPGLVEVVDVARQDVSGWGGEVSVSWELPLELEPVLSFSYAYGSGDDTPGDGTDDAFRQTSLQGNNGKFRGLSRFRYYGETLRPELSNVAITTLALGSPAPGPRGDEAWIELIYHNYRQVELATDFVTSNLDVDPNGLSDDLGDAFDLVYAFEIGRRWEFEANFGGFRYGDAFGAAEGEWAKSFSFKLDYNF